MTYLSSLPSGQRVRTRRCKSALNRTGIPGGDFCLNPYLGCTHGCLYCYASFMLRYSGINEPWGSFVEAKINLPEVLLKEAKRPGQVLLGTVCDPYQPVEEIFHLSRRALEILGSSGYQVEVMTKSDLVLRDLDLLKRFKGFSVEMTITTIDEKVGAIFEPNAPSPFRRLKAVAELVQAGVETTVFFGPVLPYFSDSFEQISAVLSAIKRTGCQRVLIDKLNYLGTKMAIITPKLAQGFKPAIFAFERALLEPRAYVAGLRERVLRALKMSGLEGRLIF
ncbi:MAG: radical SAM protein [candidate division WOR-3 bacterium]